MAQASALFVRRGPQPDGHIWSPPVQMPPMPLGETSPTLFMRTYGWGSEVQNPEPDWPQTDGPKYTWLHENRPLIDDEPLSAFTRAAMAGDITASIANWGTNSLEFINVDYTLTLTRLPEGPQIGLASSRTTATTGWPAAPRYSSTKGPIGTGVSVAVAHSGFRPPPPTRRCADVGWRRHVLGVDCRCGATWIGPAASPTSTVAA